jgi:hypothetical protein
VTRLRFRCSTVPCANCNFSRDLRISTCILPALRTADSPTKNQEGIGMNDEMQNAAGAYSIVIRNN